MRVVALLSGGKDSVAAVEVAQGHAWDVVGALRMVPDEDDAHMFHTPNLGVVEGVAQALGLPLATAAAPADPGAEVLAMEDALRDLQERWALDGVVSGALASEYQRTRIDGVCHRLGLRSFAPLWHKEPGGYVQGLVAGGYDIRMSRVAADGLDAGLAGARLDGELLARLGRMRLHVAGEGGEYETLVLDAPHYRKRIVVDEAEVEAGASRATWHVRRWHLEGKLGHAKPGAPTPRTGGGIDG